MFSSFRRSLVATVKKSSKTIRATEFAASLLANENAHFAPAWRQLLAPFQWTRRVIRFRKRSRVQSLTLIADTSIHCRQTFPLPSSRDRPFATGTCRASNRTSNEEQRRSPRSSRLIRLKFARGRSHYVSYLFRELRSAFDEQIVWLGKTVKIYTVRKNVWTPYEPCRRYGSRIYAVVLLVNANALRSF